jgi:hypothetical protein
MDSSTDKRIDDLRDRISEGSQYTDRKLYRLEEDIRELRREISELRFEMDRHSAAQRSC